MKFENIKIKNFRNFEDVNIDLSNKNIFFGLNDVGKTNFLYALRYIFDKDVRKLNLIDSDFHNKQLNKVIEIIVTLDITDTTCTDCQKLRAQLKGALLSEHKKVFIKLEAKYDTQEMLALPILYWGGDMEHLHEMKQRGYLYELDYVFNVIYIDSYVDLHALFKKNVNGKGRSISINSRTNHELYISIYICTNILCNIQIWKCYFFKFNIRKYNIISCIRCNINKYWIRSI